MHALAIDGDFDDAQARVKEMFNDHAFRDAVGLAGGQLDQLGAGAGAGGLLLHRRGRARRAAPPGQLHRADRQFRRRLRRLRRQAHGAADRAAGDRHQPQRHPAPRRSTAGRTSGGGVRALDQPVDGHPGQLELRAAAVRALRPRRRGGRRADGRAADARRLRAGARARSARLRAEFDSARASEDETRATIAAALAATGAGDLPAHRRRRPRRPGAPRRPGGADGDARHRASGEVPRRGRGRLRRPAGAAAAGWPICSSPAGAADPGAERPRARSRR